MKRETGSPGYNLSPWPGAGSSPGIFSYMSNRPIILHSSHLDWVFLLAIERVTSDKRMWGKVKKAQEGRLVEGRKGREADAKRFLEVIKIRLKGRDDLIRASQTSNI